MPNYRDIFSWLNLIKNHGSSSIHAPIITPPVAEADLSFNSKFTVSKTPEKKTHTYI